MHYLPSLLLPWLVYNYSHMLPMPHPLSTKHSWYCSLALLLPVSHSSILRSSQSSVVLLHASSFVTAYPKLLNKSFPWFYVHPPIVFHTTNQGLICIQCTCLAYDSFSILRTYRNGSQGVHLPSAQNQSHILAMHAHDAIIILECLYVSSSILAL